MKLCVVVGTRPEIIKMAPVVRACAELGVTCSIVHTGQHYSWAMDGVFFEELGLPAADVNLEVGSGTHPMQIGAIVSRMETAIATLEPNVVLVEGDTNSVLGAAITANKMGIAVGHVEAGLRSADRGMPEEINRILVDHLAEHLFAPTETAGALLRSEGIPDERIHVTGNTVVDELLYQAERVDTDEVLGRFGLVDQPYAVATVHRAENVNHGDRLRGIFSGLEQTARQLQMPVLAALHPRTADTLAGMGVTLDGQVRALPPQSYLTFLGLHLRAALMLTDSGGLQEEACVLRVPCVTLRDNTERPESVAVGANRLAGADATAIVAAARDMVESSRDWPNPFGDGHAGQRIVRLLLGEQETRIDRPRGPADAIASVTRMES